MAPQRGGAASHLRELIAAVNALIRVHAFAYIACGFAHNDDRIFVAESYCDSEQVVEDPEESGTGSG